MYLVRFALCAVLTVNTCTLYAQANRESTDSAALPDAPSNSLLQQQTTQTPDLAHPNETEAQRKLREQREEAAREVKAQEKQRIGSVIPDFNVVLNGHAVPLSGKQKLDIAFHTSIDPYTFGLAAIVGGGYGEIEDSHTGYGHGASGYFKRFGAAYVDAFDGIIIGNGLLPVVLRQDPRYYRKIHGSIMSRILYSAESTFVCHGDNGKLQPNVSNVLGNFIAGGISNAYYPSDERGVGLTIENASIQTIEGAVGAQLLEFSPDVSDWLKKRHERKLLLKQQKANGTTGQPTTATTPQPPPAE